MDIFIIVDLIDPINIKKLIDISAYLGIEDNVPDSVGKIRFTKEKIFRPSNIRSESFPFFLKSFIN